MIIMMFLKLTLIKKIMDENVDATFKITKLKKSKEDKKSVVEKHFDNKIQFYK